MNPTNCKYTKDHEWARIEGKIAIIGISEFASKQLGDVVFVDVPQVGTELVKGKTLGVVESVKTVSDIFAPLSGKVIERNAALEGEPAKVNEDPFGSGWMIKIELSDPGEVSDLMDVKEYEEHCAHSEH
ncbi:MAG: glycine cleavage system protein GcvH [Candidatus Riflebacteria bacterium]|nr:glycine cleavage system protein GcvH [Candidatus Riflebacteria bacterium]